VQGDLLRVLLDAQQMITSAKESLKQFSGDYLQTPSRIVDPAKIEQAGLSGTSKDIYDALREISDSLANSYAQVKMDLQDASRSSWAGTAHEIREVLSNMLRIMAPDEYVKEKTWYQQEKNTSGPTQKQRVRYILEQRGAGSKQREVVEKAAFLEDWIGEMVRATYSRASDAAHRKKSRTEVNRITSYFEAFAQDLLDLE
jgi:hypothetical protein